MSEVGEKNVCEECPGPGSVLPVTTVKPAWFWIKDTKGYGSVTVTFATVAFWVTALAYVASIFESIGPVVFRAFDSGACAAFLIPILTMYVGRKYTEAKYKTNEGA